MTALLSMHYNGCSKVTEEEDDRETLGKEIWKEMWGHGLLVELEEDGDSSAKQSWIETSDL